ncbi:hypothetical protein QUF84_25515 [Fictibacillus enclensis]|uniref:hypothetical protein n=1 Tax=Fictibacillus enclensis TaxID=1017270 RepID=UPI0025A16873|nr:hypothetical protein [Fictibacillus enclensis]MDM5340554.1 hypothetical protein [Fictibacillus enclensis]
MKKLAYSLIVLALLTTGCNKENGMDRDEIKGTAKVVVKEFWESRHKTYVVTGYDFPNEDTGTVHVLGYVKGKEENKMYTIVEYMNDYEVLGYANGVGDK